MYQIIRDPECGCQRVIEEFESRRGALDYLAHRASRVTRMGDEYLDGHSDYLSIRRKTGEIVHYYVVKTG